MAAAPGAGTKNETGIDPALRGDGEVLVPNDLPVRVGSFIEEEGADREARIAEDCCGELPKRRRRGQSGDARFIE
jgi:hypothetical protein